MASRPSSCVLLRCPGRDHSPSSALTRPPLSFAVQGRDTDQRGDSNRLCGVALGRLLSPARLPHHDPLRQRERPRATSEGRVAVPGTTTFMQVTFKRTHDFSCSLRPRSRRTTRATSAAISTSTSATCVPSFLVRLLPLSVGPFDI